MMKAMEKELRRIAKKLEGSAVDLPFALKLKTAKTILGLMARRKNFGLFVILGWRRKWRKHLDISDSSQDIFARSRRHDISETLDFDGAVLIDRRGAVIHSGVFIEGLRPRAVADKLRPGRYRDLSEQFGFEAKVHARHLAAITASYVFKGTTVYTVSEETNAFHIFEGGRIIHHRG